MTRISDYFPVSGRMGEKSFKGNKITPKSASKAASKDNFTDNMKENSKEKEYLQIISDLKEDKNNLEKEVQDVVNNHNNEISKRDNVISRAQTVLKELLRDLCIQDKKRKRERMYKNSLELANVVQER